MVDGTGKASKLSQEDLLRWMSPAPFDQRNVVPSNAIVEKAADDRWWRSDSPPRTDEARRGQQEDGDETREAMEDTRGSLGLGRRSGPGCYQSQYQCGSGTAANFNANGVPHSISGYGGHIPGKYAGNIVGGTFDKASEDCQAHLATTAQARLYAGPSNSFRLAGEAVVRGS